MARVTDAHNLLISAYDQPLVLDNDGELHYIEAGQTYRVAVGEVPDYAVGPGQAVNPHRGKRIVMWLMLGSGVLTADDFPWNLTESPSSPTGEFSPGSHRRVNLP